MRVCKCFYLGRVTYQQQIDAVGKWGSQEPGSKVKFISQQEAKTVKASERMKGKKQ